MITQEIREIIIQELPEIVKHDEEIHQLILHIASGKFSDKQETTSRFDRILDELRKNREAQEKKWEEQGKRWETQEKQWEVQEKKWEDNQKTIHRILDRLEQVDKRIDQTIGALGARWGLQAEEAFRNGLKAILEGSADV